MRRERDIKAARGEDPGCDRKSTCGEQNCMYGLGDTQSDKRAGKNHPLCLQKNWGYRKKLYAKGWKKFLPSSGSQTNVEKETGDEIRNAGLAGIKVDEDYKRYYPLGDSGVQGTWDLPAVIIRELSDWKWSMMKS